MDAKSSIITVLVAVCIGLGIVIISSLQTQRNLAKENAELTEKVSDLSYRMSDAIEDNLSMSSVAKKAMMDARMANSDLESALAQLASTKKMIALYKKTEHKALVSYITDNYRDVPHKMANEIATAILRVSKEERVPVSIIVAITEVESGFNPMAKSVKKARGLMQVMPLWVNKFDFVKNGSELHDIYTGLKAGTRVFRLSLDKADGSIKKALAYYKGPKYVAYIQKVLRIAGEYEVYKSNVLRPVKSVLQNYYTTPKKTTIQAGSKKAVQISSILYDLKSKGE